MDRKDERGERMIMLIRIVSLVCSLLIVIAVAVKADYRPEVLSEIDNRPLQEFPEELDGGYLELYFSDRIGFRKEMVGAYSVLNDALFGVMDHPTYEYGDDGVVFSRFYEEPLDEEYIRTYAQYVRSVQEYLDARGIDFLYVITPSKSRVYPEYVPDSVGPLANTSDILVPELESLGVEHLDLADPLIEAKDAGVPVFNRTYDAGHWSNIGALVGSQAIVDEVQALGYHIEDFDLDDYVADEVELESLPMTYFPIDETTTQYLPKMGVSAKYDQERSQGVVMESPYSGSSYYESKRFTDAPSLLLFNGSYFNNYMDTLKNQFSDTRQVHNYLNIFRLPYFVEIAQPDIVIWTNADYTVDPYYYPAERAVTHLLPPSFDEANDLPTEELGAARLIMRSDSGVTNYGLEVPDGYSDVWIELGEKTFDTVREGPIAFFGVSSDEAEAIDHSQGATAYLRAEDGSHFAFLDLAIEEGAWVFENGALDFMHYSDEG